jgi:hypothetical protein
VRSFDEYGCLMRSMVVSRAQVVVAGQILVCFAA